MWIKVTNNKLLAIGSSDNHCDPRTLVTTTMPLIIIDFFPLFSFLFCLFLFVSFNQCRKAVYSLSSNGSKTEG